jgi:hypothetical protein
VTKNNTKTMSETGVYQVDLISSAKINEKLLSSYKFDIQNLDFDEETLELISECSEINPQGFLEIYIESENAKFSNSDELVSLIKNLDSIIEFANKSEFSWTVEFPYSRKSWQKNALEWELVYDENDDYDGDDNYDEWNEDSDW